MREITFALTEKMDKFLYDVMEQSSCSDRGEVVRRAISLYGLLVDEKRAGKQVFIVDPKTGKKESMTLP